MGKGTKVVAGETGELKETKLTTTIDEKGKETVTTEEVLDEHVYTQPTCNIGLSMGFTRNTGNFNNVKCQVSLFAPCYPEEVHDTFLAIKEVVDEKLGQLSDEVNAAHGID